MYIDEYIELQQNPHAVCILFDVINITFIFEEKNWNELPWNHMVKCILDQSTSQSYFFVKMILVTYTATILND